MASSARIEELEKKFNENPRRYFAPLANEYRKAGDIEQAIAICRTYVPQQPAHMSGHIVFGQALYEAGQQEEARDIFEVALTLDPENLIALRHLGDIARARGEREAARGWYTRVLDADPRNDEVASLLASIESMANGAATTPDSWEEINPEETLELPPSLADAAARDAAYGSPSAPGAQPSRAVIPESLWPDPTAAAEDGGLDLSGARAFAESLPDEPSARPDRPRQSDDPDDRAPEPPSGTTLGLEVMEFVPPPRDPSPAVDASEMFGMETSDDTPSAFVTETMAELYLQQGFHGEALNVYRQLLARSPSDATLRERVQQLESGAQSSVAEAAVISSSVVDAAARRQAAPAPRSIRAFFGTLAGRRVGRFDARPDDSATGQSADQAGSPSAAAGSDEQPPTSEAATTVGTPFGGESEASPEAGAPPDASPAAESARTAVADSTPETASESASESAESSPVSVSQPPSQDESPVAPDGETEPPLATAGAAEAESAGSDATGARGDQHGGDVTASTPTGDDAASVGAPTGERGAFEAAETAEGFGASGLASLAGSEWRNRLAEGEEFGGDALVSRAADESTSAGLVSFGFDETDRLAPSEEFGASALGTGGEASARTSDEGPAAGASESGDPAHGQGDDEADAVRGSAGASRDRGGRTPPMQTGSVSVLFRDEGVSAPDEAAAHALADAYGGPSEREGAERTPERARSTRPQPQALSLDSVFREAPASAEPRREATAFSFDQFFGDESTDADSGAGGDATGADAASADPAMDDAEQFSNWLAGLKKK